MFIDLSFYVSAVKMKLEKKKKKSLCDIWQALEIALSLDKEIDFYLAKKGIPRVQGIYL